MRPWSKPSQGLPIPFRRVEFRPLGCFEMHGYFDGYRFRAEDKSGFKVGEVDRWRYEEAKDERG